MSIAEKLTTIAENTKSIYQAGVNEGKNSVSTPTDDRTSMAFWYQYLNANGQFNGYYDFENEGKLINELEYPKGTQNITSFKDMLAFYYDDSSIYYPQKSYIPVVKLVGSLDMSSAVDLSYAFYGLKYCTDLGSIIFPKSGIVKSFQRCFGDCYKLENFPNIDTTGATNLSGVFSGCKKLTKENMPEIDSSSATDISYFFQNTELIIAPELDTSNATNAGAMFYGCSKLTDVPLYDFSNVTKLGSCFMYCSALKEIPPFDFKNTTTLSQTFLGCSALETLPKLDIRSCTNAGLVISNCTKIKDVRFKNIKTNLALSPSSVITLDSLLFEIQELRDTGSVKTLTIGATNLAKISSTYVKTIPITDDMRAEDDLIDEKLPFEVCESTDTGAMLITDYALSKNWQIK